MYAEPDDPCSWEAFWGHGLGGNGGLLNHVPGRPSGNMTLWGAWGRLLGFAWVPLGASWDILGASGGLTGKPPGAAWGPLPIPPPCLGCGSEASSVFVGISWYGFWAAVWEALGEPLWGLFGFLGGPLGGLLAAYWGPSWGLLGPSRGLVGPSQGGKLK